MTTWDDLKLSMINKFVSSYHSCNMQRKLEYTKWGSDTVEEYYDEIWTNFFHAGFEECEEATRNIERIKPWNLVYICT